jgi:dihydroflavonol-4-reductase
MAVLVTGATGFIGAHVVIELLSRGIAVRAMMRNVQLAEMFPRSDLLEVVKADLFDIDSLRSAVQGCEDVIHCAAALYVSAKDIQKEVVDPSIIGTENLCSVMQDVKRIVHTSSVAAIRPTKYQNGQLLSDEDWCDDATVSTNGYGLAKAEAEKRMRSWAEGKNIRLVTIHPSVVFGPLLHKRHAEGSMSYLKHFVRGPPFVLDIHINFVDVRDVAIAHVNALDLGRDRQRYILHKQGMWMNEIGRELTSTMGKKYTSRKLMKPLAYLVAMLHPKLSIKRLKGSLGKHVDYDVKDTFQVLQLPNFDTRTTLKDAVTSLEENL